MENAGTTIVRYWTKTRAPFLLGLNEDAIRGFELQHGLDFPIDFRDYLRAANGNVVPESTFVKDGFAFWPLERYIVHELTSGLVVTFADYREEAFWYGLYRSRKSRRFCVIMHGTNPPMLAASTFLGFVRLCIQDSPRLLPSDEARAFTERHNDEFDLGLTDRERETLYFRG